MVIFKVFKSWNWACFQIMTKQFVQMITKRPTSIPYFCNLRTGIHVLIWKLKTKYVNWADGKPVNDSYSYMLNAHYFKFKLFSTFSSKVAQRQNICFIAHLLKLLPDCQQNYIQYSKSQPKKLFVFLKFRTCVIYDAQNYVFHIIKNIQ